MCFSNRELHGKCRSVLALAHHDPIGSDNAFFAGREIALEVAVVLVPIRLWHQHSKILSNCFVLRVPELPDGGCIERDNRAILLADDRGVEHSIENRP